MTEGPQGTTPRGGSGAAGIRSPESGSIAAETDSRIRPMTRAAGRANRDKPMPPRVALPRYLRDSARFVRASPSATTSRFAAATHLVTSAGSRVCAAARRPAGPLSSDAVGVADKTGITGNGERG